VTRLVILLSSLESDLRHRLADQRGQSTVEYALVVLGAASVALVLVAWASRTGRLSELLDKVMDSVAGKLG
jgi:Flp pilus assembly pilin Flp